MTWIARAPFVLLPGWKIFFPNRFFLKTCCGCSINIYRAIQKDKRQEFLAPPLMNVAPVCVLGELGDLRIPWISVYKPPTLDFIDWKRLGPREILDPWKKKYAS
jgi:hypothetical protein